MAMQLFNSGETGRLPKKEAKRLIEDALRNGILDPSKLKVTLMEDLGYQKRRCPACRTALKPGDLETVEIGPLP